MNDLKVIEKDGETLADSRDIAVRLGLQHETVMKTIRTYSDKLEVFGSLRFQIGVKKNKRGGEPPKYALLNFDQALLTGNLSKNTSEVVDYKVWLIKGFQVVRKILMQQNTPAIPKSFSEALQLAADQAKMIEKMQPKVLCYDKFLDATTTITMTVCAKLLGINPNRFFKWLREIGACYKNNSQIIRNEFLENGWFVQKMYAQEVPKDGGVEIHPRGQARVTMKGLDGLEKLAKKQGLIPQDYIVEFKDISTTDIQDINSIDITEENLDFDDQDIDTSKINLDDVLGD